MHIYVCVCLRTCLCKYMFICMCICAHTYRDMQPRMCPRLLCCFVFVFFCCILLHVICLTWVHVPSTVSSTKSLWSCWFLPEFPAAARIKTCFLRGEGLTRIALRKYTSFSDHLAVKHFGARPSIHPHINRFSVTLRLSISEPGRAYIQTSTVSASPCG